MSIKIEHVSHLYGEGEAFEKKALDDVTLEIPDGQFLGVIGHTGSGKSTLLRCCTFLETLSSGKISYMGQEAVQAKDGKRPVYAPKAEFRKIQHYFGLVFQNFNLFPHYSVLRNITEAPRLILKKSRTEAEKTAMELLKKVGLADKAKAYPCELSGGQQQRVAIVRALAMSPSILFFDEPTSALDPELTGEILEVIRLLAEDHMTMVIVTHEMSFARAISNRIIFMADGYIVEEGTPEQIFERPAQERTRQFLAHYQ